MIRKLFTSIHFTASFHPIIILFVLVILARITQYLWNLSQFGFESTVSVTSVLSARSDSCYFSNSFFYWKVPNCQLEEIGSIYRVIGRVGHSSDDGFFSKKRLIVEDIRYFDNQSLSDHSWYLVFSARAARFRRSIHERILATLSLKPGGVLLSLIFGTQEYLDSAVRRYFETTGTLHILAVSGLHVSLCMGVVQASIAPFMSGRRKAGALWLISCLYVLLVGLKPSILRAWGMMSLVLLSRHWLYRHYSPLRLLWIVAGSLVLVRPDWVFHPGLQLSVAATASILLLSARLERLARLLDVFPDLQGESYAVGSTVKRTHLSLVLDPLLSACAVSVAAHIATFPLVLYHFGAAPVLSFLPSTVATLAGGYLLIWLFLATPLLLLSSAVPWLQDLLVTPIEVSIEKFVQLLQVLTFTNWYPISIDWRA